MKDETKKRIADLLSSEEPDTRRRAAEDLSAQNGLAVIAALAAALNDGNKGVRDAAAHALLTTGGANVARAIVEYIADDNIVTRNLAGELLRQMGKESVHALLPYIQDTNHDVRKFAVDLIGLIGWEGVAHQVVPLLHDRDANVVAAAIEALGNLRNPEVVPQLIQTYKKFQYAQAPIAEALGKIGGEQASEFVLLTFNKSVTEESPDRVVLYTLIESLGAVGDEHALIMLQNRVQNVRGKTRHAVLHAIVRIAERIHGKVDLPLSLTRDLLDALKDDDPRIKASAAKGLASSTDSDVTQGLLQCFAMDETLDGLLFDLLEQRDDALIATVENLSTQTWTPRKQGIKLIGRLASRLIQKILVHEPYNVEEDILIRAFAIVEAEWAGADEETRSAIVDTLFHLDGDRTVGFLDTIMEDPDPWLRMHVIEQLAAIGDRRVPMFVNRFIEDDDEMVREVAMSILQSRPTAMDNGELVV
jgi:HEAT repeat protein